GGGGGGGGGRRGGGNRQAPAAPGGGAAAPKSPEGAAPYGLLAEPEPVAASDLSFAGRISLADFKRRAGQRFDRLDVMMQGYLLLADLPKTQAQLGRRPGGRPGGPRPDRGA
ncbi:MAG: hypothetical protein JWO72_760, partial [Caulobacteraceae bacterium]|nr:hypothetical protein [Caulobacteraceae bacterium]